MTQSHTTQGLTGPQGPSGSYMGYIKLEDQKSNTTVGGTPSAATWNTRTLNTEVADTNNDCSLSSNQFTLTAGTYEIFAMAAAYRAGRNKLRLRNTTDGTTLIMGINNYALASGDTTGTTALLVGTFTVSASKTLEIQHYTESANGGSQGLGAANSTGETEVYCSVEIRRVS